MSTTPRSRRARTSAALLCACTLLAACQDGPVTSAERAPVFAAPGDPLAQRIVEMGFRADMIVDAGDHFVVEGDILFRKSDLAGAPRLDVEAVGDPLFHYRVTNIVSQGVMAQGLRVDLTNITGNAAWTQAARNAMAQWNVSAGNKVKFVEVTSSGDVTFGFNPGLGSTTIAAAQWPINGYPGWSVQINTSFNGLSSTQKLNAMVHELGHAIGMRHTNYASVDPSSDVSTYGAVHITGTPTGSESASVMYSVNHNWNGFTTNDRLANGTLYPAEDFSLTAENYSSGNPHLEWAAAPYATSYVIDFNYYVDEFVYEPTFPDGGYWTWVQYTERRGSTTGTSFTDTGKTYTGSDACGAIYEVHAVYPSGKSGGRAVSQGFAVC
jgi:hypothetical protein